MGAMPALLSEGARSRSGSERARMTASLSSRTVGSCSAPGSGAELVLSSLLCKHICRFGMLSGPPNHPTGQAISLRALGKLSKSNKLHSRPSQHIHQAYPNAKHYILSEGCTKLEDVPTQRASLIIPKRPIRRKPGLLRGPAEAGSKGQSQGPSNDVYSRGAS